MQRYAPGGLTSHVRCANLSHDMTRRNPTTWFVVLTVFVLTIGCTDDSSNGWTFRSGPDDGGVSSDTRRDSPEFDADGSDAGTTDTGGDKLPPCWRELQSIDPLDPDSCPEPNGPDEDGDGLSNSLEASLCTDPDSADTDGDGLPDCTEHHLNMDPCSKDTDDDGAGDRDEVLLCLDPTDPSEPVERQSWILNACSGTDPPEAKTVTASNGIWQFDVGGAIENYSQVPYSGTKQWVAAGKFGVSAINAKGVVISFPVDVSNADNTAEYILDGLIRRRMGDSVTIQNAQYGPVHDVFPYMAGRWIHVELSTDTPKPPETIRNQLASDIASIPKTRMQWGDGGTAIRSSTFEVGIGIAYQQLSSSCDRQPSESRYIQVLLAVSPTSLDATQRQALRFATLPERLNWGNAKTSSDCTRVPLAIAPTRKRSSGDWLYRFDAEPPDRMVNRWMPGSLLVRAADQRLQLGARAGYHHHLDSNGLWLAASAWPRGWPKDRHRFVAFHHQRWLTRCRQSCGAVNACTQPSSVP